MIIPNVLKNFNLFIDGRGYAGIVEELNLPKINLKLEEHRVGGMDTPVQLTQGIDKLESDFTLSEYDPLVIQEFGTMDGAQVPLKFRGGLDNESGAVTPVEVTLTGSWNDLDFGNWKAGEKAPLKIMLAVRYYKLVIGGQDLIEIDVLTMVRSINGVDQLADMRAAIGL